jgi:hypothetical protein
VERRKQDSIGKVQMSSQPFSHRPLEPAIGRDVCWLKPQRLTARAQSPAACGGLKPDSVKDAARAIALLQTTTTLKRPVYNIGSGHSTTNQQIVEAIQHVVPSFAVELPSRPLADGPAPEWYFDITTLREDIGFAPQFDLEAGIADYIAWLRAGNER